MSSSPRPPRPRDWMVLEVYPGINASGTGKDVIMIERGRKTAFKDAEDIAVEHANAGRTVTVLPVTRPTRKADTAKA
jgi:hypothetical protein